MAAGDHILSVDDIIIMIKPTSNGITAGSIVCLTDDHTGSTAAGDFDDTKVIGVALGTETDTTKYVAVCPIGVFVLTATATTFTAGKTVIAASNTTVEDGTTAGKVIGRALETVASAATGEVLINV